MGRSGPRIQDQEGNPRLASFQLDQHSSPEARAPCQPLLAHPSSLQPLLDTDSWGDSRSFPFLKPTACLSHHPATHWSCKGGPPGVRHTRNTCLDAQVTESSLPLPLPSFPLQVP